MITEGWGDYALLDSGHGRKLERAGRMTVIRPEPQAMWSPALTAAEWDRADAMFDADKASDDDGGRWDFARRDMPETWPMRFQGSASWAGSRRSGIWASFRSRRRNGAGCCRD
ncbi:hypothetical protein ACFQ4K_24970 [Tistrella bauzanensis]